MSGQVQWLKPHEQRRFRFHIEKQQWSTFEQRSSVLISGILRIPIALSLIYIAKNHGRFHIFLSIFYTIASVSFNIALMIPRKRVYLHFRTWKKVTFISGMSLWNLGLIYLMDIKDYPYVQALYEYIQFGVIIIIQENKPECYHWNWYPVLFHILLYLIRILYLIVYKRSFPKYNKKNLFVSIILFLFAYICTMQIKEPYKYDPTTEMDDYLRIWHALFDMFIGIAFHWFWKILPLADHPQIKKQ